MTPLARMAAVALLVFGCALFGIGAQASGYSHAWHPVAFAGATGVPWSALFNAMVFTLPGVLLVLVGWHLRAGLPNDARWLARIGAVLLQLSAAAFAMQGVLPLDLEGIDDGASRLHAAAWMAWWIAFAAGAPIYIHSMRHGRVVALVGAALVLVLALFAGDWMPAGIAQRIAFAAWFGWFWYVAARGVSRAGASAPG